MATKIYKNNLSRYLCLLLYISNVKRFFAQPENNNLKLNSTVDTPQGVEERFQEIGTINAFISGYLTGKNALNTEQIKLDANESIGIILEENAKEKESQLHQGMLSENTSDWEWAQRGQELFYPDKGPQDQTRQQYPNCTLECEDGWVEDGWCDSECNYEECGHDGGDCKGWCAGECRPGWEGDNQCDANCYKEECLWDKGDCKEWQEKGYKKINTDKEATWDFSKCDCDKKKLGNKKCNPECNTYECRLDDLDCLHDCDEECPKMWTGDGACDMECDNPNCFHDKGDCTSCSEGCRTWMMGNGLCDTACNNQECHFDEGDCEGVTKVTKIDYKAKPLIYEFCAQEFIGDGHCDHYCYNKESDWDQDDCKESEFANQMSIKGIGPQFDSEGSSSRRLKEDL